MSTLTLTQIYLYPIKSLRGIAVSSTNLTAKGPQWDRRWMLVDQAGRFISQRESGTMALLQPYLEEDQLRISDLRGGRKDLLLPLEGVTQKPRKKVTIWNDACEAVAVSEAADQWFSDALAIDCQLVYMPDDSHRPIDPRYAKGEEEAVSFADGYPYLIIGEASMTALNARLPEPIDVIRFRPNLVFSGGDAFSEDHWGAFSIGSAQFRGTKPCARCQIPTIDLQTGKTSKEPTRTLATFRKQDHKILFGLNACWEIDVPENGTRIQVGDSLII